MGCILKESPIFDHPIPSILMNLKCTAAELIFVLRAKHFLSTSDFTGNWSNHNVYKLQNGLILGQNKMNEILGLILNTDLST